MGQCLAAGWSEKQFWRSSYRSVYNLIYTINQREDNKSRENWEQVRLLCTYLVAPHRKKSTENKKVFDLPWDEQFESVKLPTKEDLARQAKKFSKWDAEIKAKHQNGKK